MKKSYSLIFLLAMLILFSQPAFAQFPSVFTRDFDLDFNTFYGFGQYYSEVLSFNTPGGGARAAGMGGAFLGLARGEMAYSWNPAAMIYTDRTKIGIDLLSKADKYQGVYVEHRWWDPANSAISSFELDMSHLSINYGGFSAPFSLDSDSDARFLAAIALPLSLVPMITSPSEDLELAVGGGYRHIFDLESEADIPGFDNRKTTFKQNRSVDAVSLGAAARISEGIGFGWNMNAYVRGSEANSTVENIWLWTFEVGENRVDSLVVGAMRKEKSTYSGFGMDFGLSADFDMVKAGAVLHSPYTLFQSMLTTRNTTYPYDIGAIDRVNVKYKMPMSASFGLAVTPVENLAFAFDFDYRPLSEAKIAIDWEQIFIEEMYNKDENAGWEDVNQYRVGAEYYIDAGFANIPLRAGFRNEPAVVKELLDSDWNITYYSDPGDVYYDSLIVVADSTFGDQAVTNIISFGTGMEFEKIWFNIAYQFGSSTYDRSVTYAFSPDNGTTVVDVHDHTYEIKREYSKLFFSVGMYF
jgi:hypothetical protein